MKLKSVVHLRSVIIKVVCMLWHSRSGISHDTLLSPFPAGSRPDDFHATFIHNIQRKGMAALDGREADVPLSVRPQLPTTTTTPPTYRAIGGRRKVGR